MNPGAKNILYKSPYNLIVTFTNGEVKQFDLLPYLEYPVYEDLKNESYRSNARVQMEQLFGMKKLILIPIVFIWRAKNLVNYFVAWFAPIDANELTISSVFLSLSC